jgi:hypothetical protein
MLVHNSDYALHPTRNLLVLTRFRSVTNSARAASPRNRRGIPSTRQDIRRCLTDAAAAMLLDGAALSSLGRGPRLMSALALYPRPIRPLVKGSSHE